MERNILLFVYGTLKVGYGNHKTFLDKATYLDEGVTKEKYEMLTTGGFPVMMHDGQVKLPALGELYLVNLAELKALDGLEGEGHMFKRWGIPIVRPDGSIVGAWCYFGVPQFWQRRTWATTDLAYQKGGKYSWEPGKTAADAA